MRVLGVANLELKYKKLQFRDDVLKVSTADFLSNDLHHLLANGFYLD